MAVEIPVLFSSSVTLYIVVLAFIAHIVSPIVTDPLRQVPGPWLARFTLLWELRRICANHFEQVNIQLHERYASPVVRIAPNRYSLSCPTTLPIIYGHRATFQKDRWYHAFGHPDDSQADLFSVIDEEHHAANWRKVASIYSMTKLKAYETGVDACMETLTAKLAGFAATAEKVDIPAWMQYYAFDIIGVITV
ncbi:MAG: hypothetical protein L6R40_004043 [Gallowayella cf. fulva]|nr:MAG: hypothetical protein L6R40_004043 [Xanthomendoza cf. fulva]